MYFSVAFIKRGFKLPPSISVEAQFRDLMMEYLKRDIIDKTDPEAPENRAKALFRYLAQRVQLHKNEAKDQENRDCCCFTLLSSILWLLASNPPQNA